MRERGVADGTMLEFDRRKASYYLALTLRGEVAEWLKATVC
jgi:hypothetical protein